MLGFIAKFNFFKDLKKDYFLYGLLLFLISFFVLPTSKMVNNVYYVFLAIPAIFYFLYSRFSDFKISCISIAWLLFFTVLILSGFLGDATFQYYKHVLYVFLFFLICSFFIRGDLLFNNKFYKVSFWIVTGYVICSAIIYWITGVYGFGERIISLPARMSGPIYTSMLISALFSISLPVWMKQKNYKELLVALLLSLFCMSFVLQSRTGLVSLFAVAFIYFSYQIYLSKGPAYIILFSLLLGSLFGFVYFFSDTIPIIDNLISRADSGRFELWFLLLDDFSKCSQVFGCGPSFETEQLIQGQYRIAHPHNIFLSLLLYTGLLSLLCFVLICLLTLYLSYINKTYWGLYLVSSLIALNFDGSHLVGNPEELWILVYLPLFMIILKSHQTKSMAES